MVLTPNGRQCSKYTVISQKIQHPAKKKQHKLLFAVYNSRKNRQYREKVHTMTEKKEKKKIPAKLMVPLIVLGGLLLLLIVTMLIWKVSINIDGPKELTVECKDGFAAPAAEAVFKGPFVGSGGKSLNVRTRGKVDADRVGTYRLRYTANYLWFWKTVSVKVRVVDTTKPVIRLVEDPREFILPGTEYDDPGFTAEDNVDGDLTAKVETHWEDNVLVYTVRDSSGNETTVRRTINFDDPVPPEITLVGDTEFQLLYGTEYVEPGFSAEDNADGDLTDQVVTAMEGEYVTYTVRDKKGNVTVVKRHIVLYDPEPPVLTLLGGESCSIYAGHTFEDPGYKATDNIDGDITQNVIVSGSVNIYSPGSYTLTYSVTDSFNNVTTAVRTVTVEAVRQPDVVPPGGKVIYLTFDDGPSQYTEKLLGILAKYNVKATFFVVNYGHREMIAREAAAGHAVGVHSLTHDYNKIYASEEAYFADLQAMNEIIYAQTGSYSTMIRFPGGSSNRVSSFNPGIMTRLTAAVTAAGYQYFDWNVSSGDAGLTTDTDEVFQNVINGIGNRQYAIVLQHDSKGYSVDAVERIILWGLANGYTFQALTPSSPGAHHHINN